jgi:hypothetical protein
MCNAGHGKLEKRECEKGEKMTRVEFIIGMTALIFSVAIFVYAICK